MHFLVFNYKSRFKIRITIRYIQIPSLDNKIKYLSPTSILNNQEFQSFKLSTTSNLNILNTFKNDYLNISGINVDNKLNNLDENIDSLYNICNDLGTTQNDLDIKLNYNLVILVYLVIIMI